MLDTIMNFMPILVILFLTTIVLKKYFDLPDIALTLIGIFITITMILLQHISFALSFLYNSYWVNCFISNELSPLTLNYLLGILIFISTAQLNLHAWSKVRYIFLANTALSLLLSCLIGVIVWQTFKFYSINLPLLPSIALGCLLHLTKNVVLFLTPVTASNESLQNKLLTAALFSDLLVLMLFIAIITLSTGTEVSSTICSNSTCVWYTLPAIAGLMLGYFVNKQPQKVCLWLDTADLALNWFLQVVLAVTVFTQYLLSIKVMLAAFIIYTLVFMVKAINLLSSIKLLTACNQTCSTVNNTNNQHHFVLSGKNSSLAIILALSLTINNSQDSAILSIFYTAILCTALLHDISLKKLLNFFSKCEIISSPVTYIDNIFKNRYN